MASTFRLHAPWPRQYLHRIPTEINEFEIRAFLAQCSNIDVLRGSVAANSSQLEIARTPGKSNWIALIGPTVRRNDRKR